VNKFTLILPKNNGKTLKRL